MKLVFPNLLGSAVKFTRFREQAVIEVGVTEKCDRKVVFVRDNAAGFRMKNAHRLFGLFQRLLRAEDFPGTGAGLAAVQRWRPQVLSQNEGQAMYGIS